MRKEIIDEIKERIDINEEVDKELLNDLNSISNPYQYIESILNNIIDMKFIENENRSKFWLEVIDNVYRYYNINGYKADIYESYGIEYFFPYILNLIKGSNDTSCLFNYQEKINLWSKSNHKEIRSYEHFNESRLMCDIIIEEKKINFIEYEDCKLTPFGYFLVDVIENGLNEKKEKQMKIKINRKINDIKEAHLINILYVFTLLKFKDEDLSLMNYLRYLKSEIYM